MLALNSIFDRAFSVPIPLRYWMATNRKLTSQVHKIFAGEVDALYQRKAESRGLQTVGSGSINFIQRFGGAINLNIHFHLLQMNGVYVRRRSKLVFKKLGVPSTAELSLMLTRVHYRIATLVQRLGYLKEGSQPEGLIDDDQLYAATLHASTQLRIATGPRCGGWVRFIKGLPLEVKATADLCLKLDGFSLHAAVAIPRSPLQ